MDNQTKVRPPSYRAVVAGHGSFAPEKTLTNDELARMVDTSDEWITTRTGIKVRHITSDNESTAFLATEAARRALAEAHLDAAEVELIIVATITPEMVFPSTASFVQRAIGAHKAWVFDLAAACSGFVYGLSIVQQFIESGRLKNALIIGAETLTKITDWTDRTSCILFGDGAGAVVLQRSTDASRGVIYSSLHADGNGWEMLHCATGSRNPVNADLIATRRQYMQIKGREVYKFAVQRFAELIEDALHQCELSTKDIKLIVPHQVNQRIIDSAMQRLGLAPDKAFVNIDKYGNTSAASIPIALDEAWRAGKVSPGDIVLFVAFGAGLTWANAVVRA